MVLESFAAAAVTLLSVVLCVIALLAYRRRKEAGLLFLAAAFALFAVKGIVLTASVFLLTSPPSPYVTVLALADVAILLLLYVMTLR